LSWRGVANGREFQPSRAGKVPASAMRLPMEEPFASYNPKPMEVVPEKVR
jgi:hypothetical protein